MTKTIEEIRREKQNYREYVNSEALKALVRWRGLYNGGGQSDSNIN